jgi:predicted transcriptional regulator
MKTYYKNQYAKFIIKALKNNNESNLDFCKAAKLPLATFYDAIRNRSKRIEKRTLIKIAQGFGYWNLKEFVEAFEQFERYGIIVKPKIEEEFTPLEVTGFCLTALAIMIGLYFVSL